MKSKHMFCYPKVQHAGLHSTSHSSREFWSTINHNASSLAFSFHFPNVKGITMPTQPSRDLRVSAPLCSSLQPLCLCTLSKAVKLVAPKPVGPLTEVWQITFHALFEKETWQNVAERMHTCKSHQFSFLFSLAHIKNCGNNGKGVLCQLQTG